VRLFQTYPELKQIIVNTKTDRAFRGLLWEKRRRLLVLRSVEIVKPGGDVVPVDGEVVIERSNVDFIQVVN
jgi:small nuclear ribonucleoprotein (snRNP)-like protein